MPIKTSLNAPPDADVSVDADVALVDLHRTLLDDGLDAAALAALVECPGETAGDYRAELAEVGVDAADGRLAAAAAPVVVDDGDGWLDDWVRVRALLDSLGTGHVDGVPTDRADLLDAVPPLLAATSAPAATPTVAVRLGVGWASRPLDQRSWTLRFLARLATGADVSLVTTDAAAARILDDHRADVPAWCLTSLRNRHRGSEAPADSADVAADARGSLSPDGRPIGVVRALARSPTGSLSYPELASDLCLDSPPYEAVSTAADRGLCETIDRPDGRTVVSLRPAGDCLLDSLAAADGGRASVDAAATTTAPDTRTDSDAPQNPPAMPCYPSAWDGGDGPGTDDGTASAAADETADMDRVDRWQQGLVTPRYADRVDWVPAQAHARDGAVSFVDVDLSDRLDPDRDGRAPSVSFDAETNSAYVGIEFSNPMQSAVALAHGLASDLLLDAADVADRAGDDLRGLDINAREMLWSGVCLGWLPARVDDGADYVDQLTAARQDLLQQSGRAARDDGDVTRSTVTRRALGLVTTVVDVLDLLGVDVTIEVRVPQCARHFSDEGNGDRRADLLDHLRMLTALSSRVGPFSAFRQLHEGRSDRRSDAFTPGFAAGEQGRTGSLTADIVVTGDGVEGLGADLRDDGLDPRPVVDDAPPISVPVDIETGTSRRRTSRTCRRMLRSRGLRPTPEAVAVVAGVASTPWGAAEAIHWGLESEDRRRDVHLDEIRRALSTLDPDRILDDSPRSARAGVAALLDADRPLSQAELADRAGISAQSWRNHRDGLIAADWVRQTDAGWRVALPFRSERGDGADVSRPPWYLRRDGMDGRHSSDVLTWLYYERGALDCLDPLDPDDALGHALDVVDAGLPRCALDHDAARAAVDDAGIPPDLLLAGCGGDASDPPPTTTARLGRSTRQTTLV